MEARNGLMEKDLIAFDGTLFQVLELPSKSIKSLASETVDDSTVRKIPEAIGEIIRQSFKGI